MATATRVHRSQSKDDKRGKPIYLGNTVIGYENDPGGVAQALRQQQGAPPPFEQLRARNTQRKPSSGTPGGTTVRKATGARQAEARVRLAETTARIRARRAGGTSGQPGEDQEKPGKPGQKATPGEKKPGTPGQQENPQQKPTLIRQIITRSGRVGRALGDRAEQLPQPGGIGGLLAALLIFWAAIVPSGDKGNHSRLELAFLTMLGKTEITKPSSGGARIQPASSQDQSGVQTHGTQPGVSTLNKAQQAAATSPTLNSPTEAASNAVLLSIGITPANIPPKPSRLPPMPPNPYAV